MKNTLCRQICRALESCDHRCSDWECPDSVVSIYCINVIVPIYYIKYISTVYQAPFGMCMIGSVSVCHMSSLCSCLIKCIYPKRQIYAQHAC